MGSVGMLHRSDAVEKESDGRLRERGAGDVHDHADFCFPTFWGDGAVVNGDMGSGGQSGGKKATAASGYGGRVGMRMCVLEWLCVSALL